MQNIILSPISLENFELLITKSVTAALTLQSEPPAVQQQEFTISELADYLRVTKATIHAYKKRGVFPYYQTGRTVYFKKSDVDTALVVGNKKSTSK